MICVDIDLRIQVDISSTHKIEVYIQLGICQFYMSFLIQVQHTVCVYIHTYNEYALLKVLRCRRIDKVKCEPGTVNVQAQYKHYTLSIHRGIADKINMAEKLETFLKLQNYLNRQQPSKLSSFHFTGQKIQPHFTHIVYFGLYTWHVFEEIPHRRQFCSVMAILVTPLSRFVWIHSHLYQTECTLTGKLHYVLNYVQITSCMENAPKILTGSLDNVRKQVLYPYICNTNIQTIYRSWRLIQDQLIASNEYVCT